MSATFPAVTRPLALDDVILLTEEIQGLTAAGVPLDVGLAGLSARVPGRLKRFAARLAERVGGGMPLDQALAAEAGALPAEYHIVITAGLRCGRFDEALSSVARYAASLRELRSSLRRALIYPGVVCGLAFCLLVAVFAFVAPLLLENLDALELPKSRWQLWLETLHRTVRYWGPGIPAFVLAAMLLPALVSLVRRSLGGEVSTPGMYLGLWRWVPGMGGALQAAHWSRFAQLLAILVEARVPYLEAARVSAAAVGDRGVVAAIEQVSGQVATGESLSTALQRRTRMPPLLRWLMAWGDRESRLAPALHEAAAEFEQRALIRAGLVQRFVPLAVVALVGGGLTAVYGLTVFLPLTSLWRGLATGS